VSSHEELLAAVKLVRDRTGDPNSWQTGLAPNEVAAVITPTMRSEQFDAILHKIRQQHPDLFGVATPGGPITRRPPDVPATPSDRAEGDAAQAIARAEAALAQQNSASSQLDMQVISAILNAHLKAVEGKEALTKLQRETEAAVQTRSDLDTPAGARDFQRFLIGKLRDIREVVLNASLDDTSKSALMAAWTSLYDASKSEPTVTGEQPSTSAVPVAAPSRGTIGQPTDDPDAGWDPLLDSLLADDPGLPAGDSSGQGLTEAAPTAAPPTAPVMPTIPNVGMGPLPGLTAPSGLPLPGLLGANTSDPALPDDERLPGSHDAEINTHASPDQLGSHGGDEDKDHNASASPDTGEAPQAGPTSVTLPDGETVTAASPQLAAAIQAAVGGTPIADAFRQQGITIPEPGTAVTSPIDPQQVTAGDIGIFIDRHALALGPDKALLDGQIQHIATVSGPGFLGWEHPPAATAAVTGPGKPDTPTPTRPATTWTTRQ